MRAGAYPRRMWIEIKIVHMARAVNSEDIGNLPLQLFTTRACSCIYIHREAVRNNLRAS